MDFKKQAEKLVQNVTQAAEKARSGQRTSWIRLSVRLN